jgi:hypothetical protein
MEQNRNIEMSRVRVKGSVRRNTLLRTATRPSINTGDFPSQPQSDAAVKPRALARVALLATGTLRRRVLLSLFVQDDEMRLLHRQQKFVEEIEVDELADNTVAV